MTGDDNQNKEANAPTADDIPEVDAEIVDEAATDSPDPFDEASQKEKPATPKWSLISAGVLLFAGLVIVAGAAGAIWFFTKSDHDQSGVAETAVTQAPIVENIKPGSAETPVDKLANANVSSVRPEAPSAPPSGETLTETVSGLPSAPETITNVDLQNAKDAATPTSDQPSSKDTTPPSNMVDAEDAESTASSPSNALDTDTPIAAESLARTQNNNDLSTDVHGMSEALDAVDAPALADISAAPAAGDEAQIDAVDNPSAASAPHEDGLDAEVIASLEAALADERERAGALEAALADARRDAEAAAATLADARMQAEEARSVISALRAENDALKTAPKTSPIAAGAIALNAIFDAAESGAPFAGDLATLKQAGPDSRAIDVLAQYADTGAPALSEIREGFNAAARAGLASANRVSADGVVERYGARIAGLFNMRPATPQPGGTPGAIISRAEHAVHESNLPTAVTELEALPEAAQDAMSDWMTRARQRIEFDEALRSLNTELAERATRPRAL